MKHFVNEFRQHWKCLMIAILCSATIINCIAPILRTAVETCLPEQVLEIEVMGPGENGGTEVWITADSNIDLAAAIKSSNIIGNCEYRLAKDYGYGYDFLISYGNNIGTVLYIPYKSITDESISIYKCYTGATAEFRSEYDAEILTLSCALNEWSMWPVSLPGSIGGMIVYVYLRVLIFLLISFVIYLLLQSKRIYAPDVPITISDKHDPSADLIRCVAAFSVVCVHSFLASGYYNTPLQGGKMLLLTFFFWIFRHCNGLFLLLTGYLAKNRKLDRRSYKSLLSILLTFLLLMTFRVFVIDIAVWNAPPKLDTLIGYFIDMDLAWYLEMYIGLAILIPFLNLIWNNTDKNQREILIFSLIFITSAFSITKNLLPSFWGWIYPITYYYIGAYLQEYPVRFKNKVILLAFVILIGLMTLATFTKSAAGNVFNWNMFGGGYNAELHSIPAIAHAILEFLLLKSIEIKSTLIKTLVKQVSSCAFGIYIASVAITDNLVYLPLQKLFTTAQDFMVIQPLAVVGSFLLAFLITIPTKHFVKLIVNIWNDSSHQGQG